MKSVTCPYCQTELTGDFHSDAIIECKSCKGRFQPPLWMLKEVIISKETCPFCKTTFNAPASSTSLIQCPSCKGKFSRAATSLNAIVPRPEGVRLATILLATSILAGSILHVILFAIGRTSGNWQLANTAVSQSVAMLPWKMLTVLFAWMLFKGRNKARILFDLAIPLGILFALMQAIGRHAVNMADKLHANYYAEIVFWFNLFASTILGIGALYYINFTESRDWFHLPKERKTSSDYPWWIPVLLVVVLCPIFLFAKAFYSPIIKKQASDSPYSSLKEQQAVAEKALRSLSSSTGKRYADNRARSSSFEKLYNLAIEKGGAFAPVEDGWNIGGLRLENIRNYLASPYVDDDSEEGLVTFDYVSRAVLNLSGKMGLLPKTGDPSIGGDTVFWSPSYGVVFGKHDIEAESWVRNRGDLIRELRRKLEAIDSWYGEKDAADPTKGIKGESVHRVRGLLNNSAWRNRGNLKAQLFFEDAAQEIKRKFDEMMQQRSLGRELVDSYVTGSFSVVEFVPGRVVAYLRYLGAEDRHNPNGRFMRRLQEIEDKEKYLYARKPQRISAFEMALGPSCHLDSNSMENVILSEIS